MVEKYLESVKKKKMKKKKKKKMICIRIYEYKRS